MKVYSQFNQRKDLTEYTMYMRLDPGKIVWDDALVIAEQSIAMADEVKTTGTTTTSSSFPKASKPKKITLLLTGAGSITIEGITMKKGTTIELDVAKAERFLKTGYFKTI